MREFITDIASHRTDRKRFEGIGTTRVFAQQLTAREASISRAQRQDFVNAMSGAVTGVNLITTDGRAGKFGITVSAMSSVSADPPMLLACINKRSPACSAIRLNQVFCVNVLSTRQRQLAVAFAGNVDHGTAYDFSIGQWEQTSNGVPQLIDATSNFECVLEHTYEVGSHAIFVGRVTAAIEGNGSPLIYTQRNYGSPCSL